MEDSDERGLGNGPAGAGRHYHIYLAVVLIAAAVYVGCILSPPSLMDDVDAVQAQIARNMVTSGDWVTARLDGVPYFEKSPLIYWLIAVSYHIFGFYDWAARIPMAIACIALAWVTAAFGVWAFGKRAGLYAGMCVATCVGLFLFTRILIPDVMLTANMALTMWSFLRVIDEHERRPRRWAYLLAASLGVALLWKSAIGMVFPAAAAAIYLLLTRQLFVRKIWRRLHPWSGLAIILLIAAPWHVLAALRNPPYFDLTMHSAPGEYHGFLWFYVINEQVLRFLNLRYPRDYNTVPRAYFWLFHLIWLFPWSVYFPAIFRQAKAPAYSRAARTRLLCLCWTGFILVFFTFSTTQEYYSMPCYPALALLLGSAMAEGGDWVRRGTRVLAVVAACASLACLAILYADRNVPNPGDITQALSQHPSAYTLSLGHMEDLTLESFAYLRLPLALAAAAFAIGSIGSMRWVGRKAFFAAVLMMVLFFHAARAAMVTFDPYLSSRPLANALLKAPPGELVIDHHYYTFSSIFFYTNRTAWLLNGRINNLVYGSYAPGTPDVFLNDQQWRDRWLGPQRCYLVAKTDQLPRFERLVGEKALIKVAESSEKVLLTNR